MGDFDVTRTHGEDLSDTMGSLLFKDVSTCILELVSNSHDADAAHINITYELEHNLLVIEDNGEGMDESGVRSFYRIGDSTKKGKTTTRKGRPVIGEFGVATIALKSLAVHYGLKTYKDGVCYFAEETFGTTNKDTKPIRIEKHACEKEERGTVITIDKLRFLEDGRSLTIEELRRKLAVGLPLSKDFSISVNGQEVTPPDLGNVVEYVIDVMDRELGQVRGSIFYSCRPLRENAGVYIKVHGRTVGGDNLDIFGESFNMGLARKIHGVVHADGLRGLISLDRNSFQKDHPKFKRVADHILDVLRQIRRDTEDDVGERQKTKTGNKLVGILSSAGRDVRDLVGTDGDPYKIEFDAEEAGAIACLDKSERTLYVNPGSRALLLAKGAAIDVRRALLEAAGYALVHEALPASARARHEEITLRVADRFTRLRKLSLADVVGDREKENLVEYREISPNRLYEYKEITGLVGWNNALIKRMIQAGVLTNRDEERVLGAQVSKVVSDISGYVPVFEALRKLYRNPPSDWKGEKATWYFQAEGAVIGNLEALTHGLGVKARGGGGGRRKKLAQPVSLPPYVRKLNTSGKYPFWIVDETQLDLLKHFVDTGELREGGSFAKPTFVYCRMPGEGAAVIYLIKLEGSMDDATVREALRSRLEFVRVLGDGEFPFGIKARSWYAPHSGASYVLGIVAGDYASPIDDVGKAFDRAGFRRVRAALDGARSLYNDVDHQRAQVLPVSLVAKFDDRLSGIADALIRAA